MIKALLIAIIAFGMPKSETGYNLSPEIILYTEMYGYQNNISPELIQAIICKESSGNQYAENGHCKGLMQLHDSYHFPEDGEDIFDIDVNIRIGTEYLAYLFDVYEDTGYALDKYHGDANAKSNFQNGTMSRYTGSILELAEVLEREHGK